MLLIDKEIKTFLANGELPELNGKQTAIIRGREDSVTNIGYDLTAECFYKSSNKPEETCCINPGESAFVQSAEHVCFDANTYGVVSLKNSRIRMGLTMDAPVYQPGHKTPILFRLTNLTNKEITLLAGEQYAMLMFHQLETAPEEVYHGGFQKEFEFRGMGDYQVKYSDQIKEIENKKLDLKNMEKTLYGNVITLLTIFIGIFSLINVNIDLARGGSTALDYLMFNLSIVGAVSFLSALIEEMMNREKARHMLWIVPILAFAGMAAAYLILK